ncbi:hypothetical protein N7516_004109 [Penicillium verrucosum]|uniref:uncharacterized protein n=1 Tax=Penicillium verrucosum TaxID=60171 RepID=UPI002545A7EF|nr:uncharacterized protein N7516_004109 [Penicillium verrucosum]KAJ5943941.1 hypothetical protein N7516_004109 [Penicillium verrucosum]
MAPSDLDQLRQNIATWSGCQENVQRRRDLRASALAVAASLGTPEDIFADAFYQVETSTSVGLWACYRG